MSSNFFIKQHPIVSAFTTSVLFVAVALMSFMAFEPADTFAITDQFTVTQSITGEIAFQTLAADVTMSPSIAGLTGGVSSGSTTVAVRTNDPQGYTLSISFASTTAMLYDDGPQYIPNYGGSPTYNFTVTAGQSDFAFAASSTNIVAALQNNGSTCGAGSNKSAANCWLLPTNAATPYTLVNRSTPTPADGELTNISFRVGVGANPNPTLPIGTYTATATLTALEQ